MCTMQSWLKQMNEMLLVQVVDTVEEAVDYILRKECIWVGYSVTE